MASANIAARLPDLARRHPRKAALVDDSGGRTRRLDFEELAIRTAAVAAGLEARGVQPGDRVLLLMPMSLELYLALLACSHLGAAAVFLDAWSDRKRVERCLQAAAPRAFLALPAAHLFRLAVPALRKVPIHLAVGGRRFPLERLERPGGPPRELPPDTPALVTFTTGSTGAPKAASRSHRFLWAQHRALGGHLQPREDDVDLPVLPIFVLNNLAAGVTTVLPDFDPRHPHRMEPARILRQVEREGVTTASGSPAFFDRLARAARLPFRRLFVGGAPVYPPQARRLQDRTAGEVHVVYGSTEAEPIAGIPVPAMLEAMEHGEGLCVGRPVPGLEVRLLRPEDGPLEALEEVPEGQPGEVAVAGDHVLPGYLDAPEEDRQFKIRAEGRVWHRTGDAARRDDQGRLWLMGRVSGRVEREGRTLWEVPVVLRALRDPRVTHAALLPETSPWGRRAILCVEVPRGPAPRLGLSPLDAWQRLARDLAPRPDEYDCEADEVRVYRSIPRDPRHRSKTDVTALRALHLATRGAQARVVGSLRAWFAELLLGDGARGVAIPAMADLLALLPRAWWLDKQASSYHLRGLPVLCPPGLQPDDHAPDPTPLAPEAAVTLVLGVDQLAKDVPRGPGQAFTVQAARLVKEMDRLDPSRARARRVRAALVRVVRLAMGAARLARVPGDLDRLLGRALCLEVALLRVEARAEWRRSNRRAARRTTAGTD